MHRKALTPNGDVRGRANHDTGYNSNIIYAYKMIDRRCVANARASSEHVRRPRRLGSDPPHANPRGPARFRGLCSSQDQQLQIIAHKTCRETVLQMYPDFSLPRLVLLSSYVFLSIILRHGHSRSILEATDSLPWRRWC